MQEDGSWRVSTVDVKKKDDIEFKLKKGSWAVALLAEYFLALTSPYCILLPEISTSKWI